MLPVKVSLHLHHGVATVRDGYLAKRLPPAEATILFSLMCRPWCSPMDLAEALWPHPDGMPDYWNESLGTQIKTLRRNLKPFGLQIENWYGRGFQLKETPDGG
jgi:DNA-binding winged helix-turn-helix (wHTH) protein